MHFPYHNFVFGAQSSWRCRRKEDTDPLICICDQKAEERKTLHVPSIFFLISKSTVYSDIKTFFLDFAEVDMDRMLWLLVLREKTCPRTVHFLVKNCRVGEECRVKREMRLLYGLQEHVHGRALGVSSCEASFAHKTKSCHGMSACALFRGVCRHS